MTAHTPVAFAVSEVVNALVGLALDRSLHWYLDEVLVQPAGKTAHVSLLLTSHVGGNIRIDADVRGRWVTAPVPDKDAPNAATSSGSK